MSCLRSCRTTQNGSLGHGHVAQLWETCAGKTKAPNPSTAASHAQKRAPWSNGGGGKELKKCPPILLQPCDSQMDLKENHGTHQENWFNFQNFPGHFFAFSRTFCIKVPGLFKDFQWNSRTFHDFSRTFNEIPGLSTTFQGPSMKLHDFPRLLRTCMNSNNKIYFLQNKNIYPAVYINNSSFYIKSKNKYLS